MRAQRFDMAAVFDDDDSTIPTLRTPMSQILATALLSDPAVAYGQARALPTARRVALGLEVVSLDAPAVLHVWLQGCHDDGATWFDLPYDQAIQSQNGPADFFTAGAPKRNITLGGATNADVAAGKNHWLAVYDRVSAKRIRYASVFDPSSQGALATVVILAAVT